VRFSKIHFSVGRGRNRDGRCAARTQANRLLRAFSAAAVAAILVVATDDTRLRGQGPSALPARLDSYIKTYAKLTPEQQKQLLAGEPVTQLLEADPHSEVSIFGAVWINAPMSRYVAAVKDIEQLEKGANFLVTKKISSPPRLEDFDKLTLPDDDVKDLKTCKVGDCEVKLSEDALTRIIGPIILVITGSLFEMLRRPDVASEAMNEAALLPDRVAAAGRL
jgi:hypothetical protein